MINVAPFSALMPAPDIAHLVAAVPYDVVTASEAYELSRDNPLSFLRVSRSEIDLPPETDPYSDVVYNKALDNFRRLIQDAPLKLDREKSFYIYSQISDGRRQTGLAAAVSVDDYDQNRIKKHEMTRKDKEDDRTRHILTLRSHTGPVFLTYRDLGDMDDVIASVLATDPLLDVRFDDGVSHQVWKVPSKWNTPITIAFMNTPFLYVADGHHRAKSASRVRDKCRPRNGRKHSGDEGYNRFLAVIFPSDQLRILPYNRTIKDLNGLSPAEFLDKVRKVFTVEPIRASMPSAKGHFHMYTDNQWYCLETLTAVPGNTTVDNLDVSILQNLLLNPILKIGDPRTDKRIDFIGGIHGNKKLKELVDHQQAAVAFSLYPVSIDELMTVSDAGLIMPPKSTWFEPKLRDGLLCHCF